MVETIKQGSSQDLFYDPSPIVDMTMYSSQVRVLSCYQCFQANGKMCSPWSISTMIDVTGSSNPGHGICCNPSYNEGYCQSSSSAQYACSPYQKDGQTQNNNLIFAFCPLTNQMMCGINSDSTSNDMRIFASYNQKSIKLENLRYFNNIFNSDGTQTRQYDSCYYLLSQDSNVQQVSGQQIQVQILESLNMNVYVYLASDRLSAQSSQGIAMVTSQTYSVNSDQTLLIVAYPQYDKVTSLQLRYWLNDGVNGATQLSNSQQSNSNQQSVVQSQFLPIIIGASAGGAVLIIIIGIVIWRCRVNRQKDQVEAFELPEKPLNVLIAGTDNTNYVLEDYNDNGTQQSSDFTQNKNGPSNRIFLNSQQYSKNSTSKGYSSPSLKQNENKLTISDNATINIKQKKINSKSKQKK